MALYDIPKPDRFVYAAAGNGASIRTPGDAMHLVPVPRERLEQASIDHFPQFDRSIPAPAGQGTSVGGKGQTKHPVGMPFNGLHTPGWCCLLDLPQPNRSRKVATRKQASIGAPRSEERRVGQEGRDRW